MRVSVFVCAVYLCTIFRDAIGEGSEPRGGDDL